MWISRRDAFPLLALPALMPSHLAAREFRADVAIIGAGVGGVAAALAAARNGMRVVLTEETAWIGGQLTSQAVPPDEHSWIEQFGANASYRAYRDGVRAFYRHHYPLTASARSRRELNPGDGRVSRLTHEPRVSLAVLEAMLAPHVSSGAVTLLTRHVPLAAAADRDRISTVTVRSLENGDARTISAPIFLDATEQGDLLPLAGVEHITGFEAQSETGEPHAPAAAQPANIQSFTVCFAIDYRAGEDHTIDKPAEYAFWRDYTPAMKPAWPGKLLDWKMSDPISLKPRAVVFHPDCDDAITTGPLCLWLYRRIYNRKNFTAPDAADISLVNWPQNDYWLGNLHGVSPAEAARHLARAKQLSLSLLYWMQAEAPRPDGGAGWKGLRLRHDVTGTADGLAMYPYIRESRRIRAQFTVLEQHVGADARSKLLGGKAEDLRAESFRDSVGVGSYRIDLHPSSGGDNYVDVSSLPFQIPMGALIPRRVENLLAAAKNLGVTHITNGCYRLHPVEWGIGEAAGLLAARSVQLKTVPAAIRKDEKALAAFQSWIRAQGVETDWPRLTPR